MLEMAYNDTSDAMSLANKNRVASKKLFEQLHQQQPSSRVSALSAFGDNHMLHRTPSGAQKRIRQRQEQKCLRAAASPSSSPPTRTTVTDRRQRQSPLTRPENNDYRSMIDSGGYRSILPEEPPLTLAPSPAAITSRHGTPYTAAVTPADTLDISTMSPAATFSSSSANISSTTTTGGKPTVQVHPMPSAPANGTTLRTPVNDKVEITSEKVREKPAVPKKPAKLILSSASFDAPSFSPVTPLSLSTSNLNLLSSSAPTSPSTSSLRLFSTPSLMCLHTAMMQPSLTVEELGQLDAKRKRLIESITRKVAVLDEESVALDEEICLNEALRKDVFDELASSGHLQVIEKAEVNLAQNSQLCRLQTKLRMQLERLETFYANSDSTDKGLLKARLERLKQQIVDQTVLRKAFDRRDVVVDDYVMSKLSEERRTQWRIYKQAWMRLASERQEIDERLQLGRDQLNALQNVQALV